MPAGSNHPSEAAQPYHCRVPGGLGFGHPHSPGMAAQRRRHLGWQSKGASANSPHPSDAPAPVVIRRCLRVHPSRQFMAAVSLSVSTVKPLGDRVFIKVSESEEKTAGGILLPDTAKEKPQVGEVVQIGPGKRNDDGSRQAPEVGVGDKVLYSKYAGTDIKLGTDEYVLLSEKDILAVVN